MNYDQENEQQEVAEAIVEAEIVIVPETEKPIDEMSIAELTAAYNAKCEELEANDTSLKPKRYPRLKAFKDRKTGVRRLRELNGEIDPAPKAPRAKATKTVKAPRAKAVKKQKKESTGSISEEFGFREGGIREKILRKLAAHMDHQVARTRFDDEEVRLMPKVPQRIARKKLKYKFVRERDDEGKLSYGLYKR